MKKYSRKWIGEEVRTKDGYTSICIDGGSKKGSCTIKIGNWVSEVDIGQFKKGEIKYPYHPSIFGMGHVGEGEYRVSINRVITKEYSTWSGIMQRCYSTSFHDKRPTYIGCSVSDEWLNFQAYAKWHKNNYVDGWELDKDLLLEGNKVYSEDTCVFIPQCLNTFLTNKKPRNTSGYTGVYWHNREKKWRAQINNIYTNKPITIGSYYNKLSASQAYIKARKEMAERMRIKMMEEYGITDKRILDAIR